MADLLLRNIPDDVIRTYDARAQACGEALEAYVGDVLAGRRPVIVSKTLDRATLIELTRRNLGRFDKPLVPLARRDLREGFEE